jgi:hypothetical protein
VIHQRRGFIARIVRAMTKEHVPARQPTLHPADEIGSGG